MKQKKYFTPFVYCFFFTIHLLGQNSESLYHDKASISIGIFFTTNQSISGVIQAEQVLIKNRNTSYHIFGGWNFLWYHDINIGNNFYKDSFGEQAYFGGFTIAERIKEGKFIFVSIGSNYVYFQDYSNTTNRRKNFYPFVHLGYKRVWEKYMFKLFLTANSDNNYNLYNSNPVMKIETPRKWYFGLGLSFGRHFF